MTGIPCTQTCLDIWRYSRQRVSSSAEGGAQLNILNTMGIEGTSIPHWAQSLQVSSHVSLWLPLFSPLFVLICLFWVLQQVWCGTETRFTWKVKVFLKTSLPNYACFPMVVWPLVFMNTYASLVQYVFTKYWFNVLSSALCKAVLIVSFQAHSVI